MLVAAFFLPGSTVKRPRLAGDRKRGALTAGLIWRTNRRHRTDTAMVRSGFTWGMEPAGSGGRSSADGYFNAVLIAAYDTLSVVPRPFTAAMMASEIPAAISAYSIAVAPD